MSITNDYGSYSSFGGVASAGAGFLGAFVVIYVIMMLLALAASVIMIISEWKIFEKNNKPGWYSLIPFLNMWTLFEIVGGFLKIERFSYIFVFLISFGNAAFFNVLNISTMEYFPTVIRGSCVGLTNIVGKAATTIVPSMTTFVSHSPFLFSFFLILSVLMMNHLEETKGKEIQDLVPELA